MSSTQDKLKTWIAGLALAGGAIGLYVDLREETTRLSEKVESVVVTNERTYEVLTKLADSVDKLSESVARLDERTKALEQN